MGGSVLDYEAKRIHDHGIFIGRNEGISIGRNNILAEMLANGEITAAQATKYQRVQ